MLHTLEFVFDLTHFNLQKLIPKRLIFLTYPAFTLNGLRTTGPKQNLNIM